MPVGIAHLAKSRAYRFIIIQCGVGLSIACASSALAGWQTAYSVLLGVLVATIPNVCFANRLFAITGASVAKQVVRNLYKAQVLKIITSVVLFIACFHYSELHAMAFFVGYLSVQLCAWLAPWLMR